MLNYKNFFPVCQCNPAQRYDYVFIDHVPNLSIFYQEGCKPDKDLVEAQTIFHGG
jgi:hypothetical protein